MLGRRWVNSNLETLEQHIKFADFVVRNDRPELVYNNITVMEYGINKETIFEHLGFFYQLSTELKTPYQALLNAFTVHFNELTKNIELPNSKPTPTPTPKVRKRTKK